MRNTLMRSSLLAGGLLLVTPIAAWAHGGHAGEHGWLAGAAQPLLSLDHLLAALFVVFVGAFGLVALGRRKAVSED